MALTSTFPEIIMIIPPEHDKLKQNEQNCMWVKNFWLIGKINKLFKISHKTEKFSVKIIGRGGDPTRTFSEALF